MHLRLSTSTFLEELQTAARVASTRSAVQALSGVQFHAADGVAELRATDMEVGLRLPLSATVESPGDVVLPARLLVDVVRALPGPEVTVALRAAEQDVEIISAGATFHLRTLRNEDFPHLPAAGGEAAICAATRLQAWRTVVWSRPSKARAIVGRECSVNSLQRYIAACRGHRLRVARERESNSSRLSPKRAQAAPWIASIVGARDALSGRPRRSSTSWASE